VIVIRTPLRVSLFGGGTDHPAWYREHGGAVLGFALNRYVWHTVRVLPPFFDHRHRVVWSKVELVRDVSEIEHPAVRAVLSTWFGPGLEIHCDADLPARSGLGSSSAFTVGLINAVAALDGRRLPPRKLAAKAIRLEQDVMAEAVGSQDQVWASHGGFNRITFGPDGFSVCPLVVPAERRELLLSSLMLFFTGFPRAAAPIEEDKLSRLDENQRCLGNLLTQVYEAEAVLTGTGDLDAIGHLLNQAWYHKRSLSPLVATPLVDDLYARARSAGALGGKLLGAGGGGFMLLYVPPSAQDAVRAALSGLIEVRPGVDGAGSTVVVYDP